METISKSLIIDLLEGCTGRAISIYMPTFISAKEAGQNPIRLKGLLSEVEDQLQQIGYNQLEAENYLAPASALVNDEVFWQSQDKGLALFLDEHELYIFRLPIRFNTYAAVNHHFNITPLIPLYQGNGLYYVLTLNQEKPRIFLGSKFKLAQVKELDLPESLQDMFDQYYEFHRHIQYHGKTSEPNPDMNARVDASGARQAMFFGHGGDDIDKNAEIRNFFHRFDKALVDFLDGESIPMVLAGVGYLHPLYKAANTYPDLLDEGLTKAVDQMSVEDLHQLTWEIVQDQYKKDVDQALRVYANLKHQEGETTDDPKTIVSAAYFKRVHTLFLDGNARLWGNFNQEDSDVTITDAQKPGSWNLLSFAAGQTLINGGNVLVLSGKQVPAESPAAAILRY